jgi:hypothetical protein
MNSWKHFTEWPPVGSNIKFNFLNHRIAVDHVFEEYIKVGNMYSNRGSTQKFAVEHPEYAYTWKM